MASAEGAPVSSTHEELEWKKFEIAELIKILAKRLRLDNKHEATTTAINSRDRRHLQDVQDELIRQRDLLSGDVGSNDKRGVSTTTIHGHNVGAGNTSAHKDPYIARLEAEKDELRRERELGMGQFAQTDGHGAATTTSNGRGSTAEAPEIIVTAPQDGNGPVVKRGPAVPSLFTPVPETGRELIINPFNGRYFYGPRPGRPGLRRRIPEAGDRIFPENLLKAMIASDSNLHDVEISTALVAYTTKLLKDMDTQAELKNENKRKVRETVEAASTCVCIIIIIGSLYTLGL